MSKPVVAAPVRSLAVSVLASAVFVPLFVVAGACQDSGQEPDPTPEPEDTCEVDLVFDADSALPLEVGAEATGVLCPARDADWYRFSVEGTNKIARITLSMDTAITAVEPGYSLFDGQGNPLGISARHPDRSPGEPVNFTGAHALDAGDYIVVVADVEGFDQNFDISNAFTLRVDVVDNPDAAEPNDTPETATALVDTATGLIGTTGDEDWFAIAVEQDAQILNASVTLPSESPLDLVAEIYDASGSQLIATADVVAAAGAEEQKEASFRVGAAGVPGDSWYLRVRERSGTLVELDPTLGTYTVQASLSDDPDVNEADGRNDTNETGTSVTSGATVTGTIATRGDQDVYRFDPGAGAANRVLRVDLTTAADENVQYQLQVVSANPERTDLEACDDADCDAPCAERDGSPVCGDIRLQRLITAGNSRTTAIAIRNQDPIFVVVNDVNDDGYAENSYTVAFEIFDDPDPGEPDNYLVPSFETRPVGIERSVIFDRSLPRARNRTANNLVESCPYVPPDEQDAGVADGGVVDAGPPPQCLPTVPVPTPGQGGQVEYTVACNGESFTSSISGRLAYEGDRDFFVVELPDAGYWGLTANYSVSTTTPVELVVFFHEGDGNLFSSFLETEAVQSGCLSSIECPEGSVCIDETCWRDGDSNPAVNGSWPTAGECFYTHVNDTRPVVVEVTDNGVNDFDPNMEYTITFTARCGCPAECDNEFLACQGVAPPP